jgi:CRP-like cAMP-binding protein
LPHEKRVSSLKRAPVLAELSYAAVRKVAQKCKWHRYGAGEQIFGRRDLSTDVYFVLDGTARAISYSSEGETVVF